MLKEKTGQANGKQTMSARNFLKLSLIQLSCLLQRNKTVFSR